MSADALALLREGGIATTVAVLLVLLLRKPVRRGFGATCVPLLWALVPLAQLAVLLPGPARSPVSEWMVMPAVVAAAPVPAPIGTAPAWAWEPWLFGLWLAGAWAMAAWLLLVQRRFQRRLGALTPHAPGVFLAAHADAGPAVLGILRPRIVLPADFRRRYTPEQQTLILAHERSHARRGDVTAQAIASLLRCLYWFNPLIHVAIGRLRHDQELATDADVIRHYPDSRRCYATTLLDAQLAVPGLPAGCLWQSSHPLKERILMLKNIPPSRWRHRTGLALVIALALGGSLAAWASQSSPPAAQPSPAKAEATARYRVNMEVMLDDMVSLPELIVTSNTPMVMEMSNEKTMTGWRGELVYDGDTRRITHAQMQVNGQPVGPVDLEALNTGRTIDVPTAEGLPSLSLKVVVSAVGDSEAAPLKVSNPPPRYPIEALRSRQSGRVLLAVNVNRHGEPTEMHVKSSTPEGVFDEAAKTAVSQWRFMPALRNGEAVESWREVPLCFRLDDAQVEGCNADE